MAGFGRFFEMVMSIFLVKKFRDNYDQLFYLIVR